MTRLKFKPIPQLSESDYLRLWSKVDICGPDECWPWKGSLVVEGYGRFWLSGDNFQATRVIFLCVYGGDPLWLFVCHRCDNPACCNPDHFFLGTTGDNTRDAYAKGRIQPGQRAWRDSHPEETQARTDRLLQYVRDHGSLFKGENNGFAKLTEEQVLEARRRVSAGESRASVSRSMGVKPGCIEHIISRRNWRHI